MRAELSNTTVVVTGASSGIGRALALQLAAAGATVVATARSVDKLETLAEEGGPRLIGLPTDISDPASVRQLAEWAHMRFGGIDAVVNNAGIGYLDPFLASTAESWQDTVETNLFGTLRMMQAFLPGMLARGRGVILNIGSQSSSGWPYMTLYAATKAAIAAASTSIDLEVADHGVRVVSIDVGATRGTEFGSRFSDVEVLAQATSTWTRLGIAWSDFSTVDETAGRILAVLCEHLAAKREC
jgi:3-hydroxy acid dehydrogenase/malonic semialdehyde reductase